MTRPGGKQVIATLAPGLSIETWVAVGRAIDAALQRLGYSDVVVLAEGGDAGVIAATPPPAGWEPPEDDDVPHLSRDDDYSPEAIDRDQAEDDQG